jgi:3-hydroxyisobutyrate dehydrogenase
MGVGMAQCLLNAGHDLRVYNRTKSKTTILKEAGARVCDTAWDACAGADVVIAMTADDASSRTVWLGADGVLAAQLAPRAFAIECSTLSYDWVIELSAEAEARDLRYIDAPVTGLPEHAAAGALTRWSAPIPLTWIRLVLSLVRSHSVSCALAESDRAPPTS